MNPLAKLDHRYVWHPFTQMRDWVKREPIVIVEGRGTVLRDIHGREYLDANSSIWTNLHGHNHPKINAAIQRQLFQHLRQAHRALAAQAGIIFRRGASALGRIDPALLSKTDPVSLI